MVDAKTLTIGSHVLVDGKRERVRGLDEDNGLIVRFPAEYVSANDVEPIPITEELLIELGFIPSIIRRWYNKSWRLWRKGAFIVEKEENTPYFDFGSGMRLEYLHELESLYYMMFKVELLKD